MPSTTTSPSIRITVTWLPLCWPLCRSVPCLSHSLRTTVLLWRVSGEVRMVHDETVVKRTVKLAHKVRKLHEVFVRGSTDKERAIARERLENLLTENRKTWSDLLSLLAISWNNPERTMDDGGDDDPPPPTPSQ